jgi:hypothetical protein
MSKSVELRVSNFTMYMKIKFLNPDAEKNLQ